MLKLKLLFDTVSTNQIRQLVSGSGNVASHHLLHGIKWKCQSLWLALENVYYTLTAGVSQNVLEKLVHLHFLLEMRMWMPFSSSICTACMTKYIIFEKETEKILSKLSCSSINKTWDYRWLSLTLCVLLISYWLNKYILSRSIYYWWWWSNRSGFVE